MLKTCAADTLLRHQRTVGYFLGQAVGNAIQQALRAHAGTQSQMPLLFQMSRELEFWTVQLVGAASTGNLNGLQLPERVAILPALLQAEKGSLAQELELLPRWFANIWVTSQTMDARVLEHQIQAIIEVIGMFVEDVPSPVLEDVQCAFARIRPLVEAQHQNVALPAASSGCSVDVWNCAA